MVGGMLVDAELTARLATAGEEELTATFTRLKPQFSALLTHNQVAVLRIPDDLIRIGCIAFFPVLRIRDVYPGSRIRILFIPDPNFFHPGSASKNSRILTQKNWFLNSRKYDCGCSSRTGSSSRSSPPSSHTTRLLLSSLLVSVQQKRPEISQRRNISRKRQAD